MLIERQQNNEIVIKLTSGISSYNLQKLMDYVKFLEIISKSKAKQKDINELANKISANWWKKNKRRLMK